MTIPVVDISGLYSPDLAARRGVAAELGAACRVIGFFYVQNHRIASDLLEATFQASKHFFSLDAETKGAVSIRHSKSYNGYFELEQEQLDLTAKPDRKEGFGISLELEAGDPRLHQPFRGPNQWPDIPGWRETLLSYFDECWSLGRRLHRGFSLDLGLEEMFFEDKLDAPLSGLRLLHYPPLPGGQPRTIPGAGEHTDYGNVTILAVDTVGGLQLKTRGGEWIDAPLIPGTLICNIGDCLMRWTNDTYVSTPHRVTVPTQDRYSLAFFLDPNPDAEVVPVIGGNQARERYPAISGADYLRSRVEPTHNLS
jgi:isopenicillin N synthase-like dioxygenase